MELLQWEYFVNVTEPVIPNIQRWEKNIKQEIKANRTTTRKRKNNKQKAQSPHPNTQNWEQILSPNVLLAMSERNVLPEAVKSI